MIEFKPRETKPARFKVCIDLVFRWKALQQVMALYFYCYADVKALKSIPFPHYIRAGGDLDGLK